MQTLLLAIDDCLELDKKKHQRFGVCPIKSVLISRGQMYTSMLVFVEVSKKIFWLLIWFLLVVFKKDQHLTNRCLPDHNYIECSKTGFRILILIVNIPTSKLYLRCMFRPYLRWTFKEDWQNFTEIEFRYMVGWTTWSPSVAGRLRLCSNIASVTLRSDHPLLWGVSVRKIISRRRSPAVAAVKRAHLNPHCPFFMLVSATCSPCGRALMNIQVVNLFK